MKNLFVVLLLLTALTAPQACTKNANKTLTENQDLGAAIRTTNAAILAFRPLLTDQFQRWAKRNDHDLVLAVAKTLTAMSQDWGRVVTQYNNGNVKILGVITAFKDSLIRASDALLKAGVIKDDQAAKARLSVLTGLAILETIVRTNPGPPQRPIQINFEPFDYQRAIPK